MLMLAGMVTFVACGPSAKEKEAAQKMKDSLSNDSIMKVEAAKEQVKKDSIAKVEAEAKAKRIADSIAEAAKAPKKMVKKVKIKK